jgi:hypothetical protein
VHIRGRLVEKVEKQFVRVSEEAAEGQRVRGWVMRFVQTEDPADVRLALGTMEAITLERDVAEAYLVGEVYTFDAPEVSKAPALILSGGGLRH